MSFQIHPDTTLDVVHLYVSNIKKSLEFYTEVLSMKVLKEDEMVVTFGNENNEPLLIIEEKKEALPKQRGRTGLYHYAILLPSRQDLANILRHLVAMVYPLHGGADHYFSEALYLADPDGNGIEIYHDRQKEVWRDENGELPFVSNPLAGEELLQQGSTWNGFPVGTVMGHIHFHVADLEEAKRFYVDGLGFEVTIPARNGALFCIGRWLPSPYRFKYVAR